MSRSIDVDKSAPETEPALTRPDIFLLLLYACNEIWGITRLAKLLFLMGSEEGFSSKVHGYYVFAPDNFGPFDEKIYEDVRVLKRLGLLRVDRPNRSDGNKVMRWGEEVDAVYGLTPAGRKYVAELVPQLEQTGSTATRSISRAVSRYATLPLERLLHHVYSNFPEMAERSQIRKRILGK